MKNKSVDVVLVGAGIMSATLGALLKEVAPDWKALTRGTMPEQAIPGCAN